MENKKLQNMMILNGKDIGISRIKLDKSDLLIFDKSGTYCFQVCVYYSWKEINKAKIGEKEKIDFNEYILHENEEPALIWPTEFYIEKTSDGALYFYFKFENMSKMATYMNARGAFDITLNSFEARAYIDYKDAVNGSIIYEF